MANVESVTLQRTEPQITRCSRFFFSEHDLLDRKTGRLVGSIYSTHQFMDSCTNFRMSTAVQTFAVLWDSDGTDTRVFNVIEEAIAFEVLSPVLLIHHSEGLLTLLVDPAFRGLTDRFEEAWQLIAANVICDSWGLRILHPQDIKPHTEGRQFREFAESILGAEALGIEDISRKHFLFKDEWEKVMNDIANSQQSEPEANGDQSAFDFSTDHKPEPDKPDAD